MKVWEGSRLALRSVFGGQNRDVSGRFLYSTSTNTGKQRLYQRISPVGDPRVSVVPILDQWVQEGKPVRQNDLQRIIKELRVFRRFHHALEVSPRFSFPLFSFFFFLIASHFLLCFVRICFSQKMISFYRIFSGLNPKM